MIQNTLHVLRDIWFMFAVTQLTDVWTRMVTAKGATKEGKSWNVQLWMRMGIRFIDGQIVQT